MVLSLLFLEIICSVEQIVAEVKWKISQIIKFHTFSIRHLIHSERKREFVILLVKIECTPGRWNFFLEKKKIVLLFGIWCFSVFRVHFKMDRWSLATQESPMRRRKWNEKRKSTIVIIFNCHFIIKLLLYCLCIWIIIPFCVKSYRFSMHITQFGMIYLRHSFTKCDRHIWISLDKHILSYIFLLFTYSVRIELQKLKLKRRKKKCASFVNRQTEAFIFLRYVIVHTIVYCCAAIRYYVAIYR